LENDVRNTIKSVLDTDTDHTYTPVEEETIADAFINGSLAIPEAYDYIKESIEASIKEIPYTNASMVSDIYGGITNNKIYGGMGHTVQKLKSDGTYFLYWYDEDGNPTRRQTDEAWAEFFAAVIMADEENIIYNEKYFPTGTAALTELAQYLLNEYSRLQRDK